MTDMLPIDKVFTRKDARKIDEATVNRLVGSIEEIGLINPIRVRPTTRPDHSEAWEVIAGGHRLRALRKLGYVEVPAVVVNDDDLRAELAMIDENLCRAELSASDRATQTARRKAIYEDLHPETRHGGDRGQVAKFATCEDRFTSATSKAIGRSERAIQLDAERGEKVIQEAIAALSGTSLDTGKFLDRLKNVAPEKQLAFVQKELAEWTPKKRQKPASDPLDDMSACERQVSRLMDAWNAAGPDARQEFMLRIDAPVFDRGRAA